MIVIIDTGYYRKSAIPYKPYFKDAADTSIKKTMKQEGYWMSKGSITNHNSQYLSWMVRLIIELRHAYLPDYNAELDRPKTNMPAWALYILAGGCLSHCRLKATYPLYSCIS